MSEAARIAVLIARLGPYHVARMRALGERFGAEAVVALEVAADSREYAWDRVEGSGFRRVTLARAAYEDLSAGDIAARTLGALEREQPAAVAVDGWGFREARAALLWCRRRGRTAILMSESQQHDADRSRPREWVKARLLREVDAALVGGERHRDYLARLGFPPEAVFRGYDAVDNDYFAAGAAAARAEGEGLRRRLGLPGRYLLASARFVPKKNLPRLVEAFAGYRRRTTAAESMELVLLGDGPERAAIEQARRAHGLEHLVHLRGFLQYPELPSHYAFAQAFILPSTAEQWGLVVNEAMAAGLPVLVSRVCGAADELVVEGRTGFRFDPESAEDIASAISRLESADAPALGRAAAEHVQRYGPRAFAEGMAQALGAGAVRRARRRHLVPNPVLWL